MKMLAEIAEAIDEVRFDKYGVVYDTPGITLLICKIVKLEPS